ncbi:MAG: vitamin K epoxide reductase family protein [Anaerolineae bacterium]
MASSTVSAPAPRRRITLWGITVTFCLIALFTSGYLSYTTATGTTAVCIEGGAFDCSKVEGSIYSRIAGVPVAYLGLITYITIFVLLLLEKRFKFFRDYGMLLVLGLSLFGFMFHSYLTYVSVTILGSVCPWCLATNLSMFVIMIATFGRVIQKFVLTESNEAKAA